MEEQQCAYKIMREVLGESSDVQTIDTEYPGWVFGLVF